MKTKDNQSILENSFCRYENLLALHLGVLESDGFPDLEYMTRERTDAFSLLKSSLETCMENAGLQNGTKNISILRGYESRLSAIMKLDEEIKDKIKKYRNRLKTNLNHIKKGKLAMNGYKNAQIDSRSPRVLSMNR